MRNHRIISIIILLTFIFSSAFIPHNDRNASVQPPMVIEPEFSVSPFSVSPLSVSKNIANLTSVTGAYYDPEKQELVIEGIAEPGLPKLRLDDFIVALRAIYSNDYPAVSIDPGKDPAAMDVKYWGETENTHFGHVMFEADRLLKTLSMGRDNITGKPVASHVQGFQTYLQRAVNNYSQSDQSSVWFRMWFETENTTVMTTTDRHGILFKSPGMIAKTEYLPPTTGHDPNADAFIAHLNENYSKYAKDYPVLSELTQLEQWLLVAKWMRDTDIPVDFSFYNIPDTKTKDTETPSTTPAITVDKTFVSGNYLVSLGLFGGVDFKLPKDNYEVSDSSVSGVINTTNEARADSSVTYWQAGPKTSTYQAIAISPVRTNRVGSFVTTESDLGLNPSIASLGFSRYYDSFSANADVFGFGWKPLPFELTIPDPTDTYQSHPRQIDVRDFITQAIYHFNLGTDSSGSLVYSAPIFETRSTLTSNSDGSYSWKSNNITAKFDSSNKLIDLQDQAGNNLQYAYSENNKLDHILDQSGKQIKFEYDKNNRIIHATGTNVNSAYTYNSNGDLIAVSNSDGYSRAYTYDKQHRLIKIVDESNHILVQNAYDDLGRIKTQTNKSSSYAFNYDPGGLTVAIIDKNNPSNSWHYGFANLGNQTSVEQPQKSTISYQYSESDPYPTVINVDNEEIHAEYMQGNLSKITLPGNITSTFNHSADGKLLSIVNPNGEITNFERNADGSLQAVIENLDNNRTTLNRDSNGNLLSVNYANGKVSDVSKLKDTASQTGWLIINRLSIDDNLMLLVVAGPDGTTREIELTRDRFIKDAILSEPEILTISNLSLSDQYEKAPQLLTKALDGLIPSGDLIVMEDNISGLNYNQAFPDRLVIQPRTDDINRIKTNLKMAESIVISPKNTMVINGIPSNQKELDALNLNQNFGKIWNGIRPEWVQSGTNQGYITSTGADALDKALQDDSNVIVVVAHSNGNTIFWPDGTQTTAQDIDKLKLQIDKNHPAVLLFSCETAAIDAAPESIVDSLLNAGASIVAAPTGDIAANGLSQELFRQLLLKSSKGQNILEALRGSEINLGYHDLQLWIRILQPLG